MVIQAGQDVDVGRSRAAEDNAVAAVYCCRCKLCVMTREALAEELSNLVARYRHSVVALELFVKYSFEGTDRNRSEMSGLLERIHKSGHQESVAEPRLDTTPTALGVREFETADQVVSRYLHYIELHPQMLLEMSLTYACALFDAFISDALLAILRHIPERLRSGRTLTVEEALRFRDRDEFIEDLAHREVLDLMYKSVEKQFDYFRTSFGVDVFADESLTMSVADLAAVRERRNLIAHNNGFASAEYVAKFDSTASVGDRVVTDAKSAEFDRIVLSHIAIVLVSRLGDELVPKA